MRNRRGCLAVIGMVGCLLVRPAAWSEESGPAPESFLLTATEVLLLDTPELVAPGPVGAVEWSPSGSFVLACREQRRASEALAGRKDAETSLVLWSARTHRSQEVWKTRGPAGQRVQLAWLGGTETALALVTRTAATPAGGGAADSAPERWLLRVDARRGTAQPLLRVPLTARLSCSPNGALAALYGETDELGSLLALVRADGRPVDLSRLVAGRRTHAPTWIGNGSALRIWIAEVSKSPERRAPGGFFVIDAATGQVKGPLSKAEQQATEETGPPPAAEPAPLRLQLTEGQLRERSTRRSIRSLWLESTSPSELPLALVSADADHAVLSPGSDGVLYVSGEAAWVRPLARVERSVYQLHRDRLLKERALSSVTQVGVALQLYAQDHDLTLPGAGADLGKAFEPFLRSSRVLEGFVYTFSGGSIRGLPEPSKVVVGYTPVPGGRVNLFANGQAQFVPE